MANRNRKPATITTVTAPQLGKGAAAAVAAGTLPLAAAQAAAAAGRASVPGPHVPMAAAQAAAAAPVAAAIANPQPYLGKYAPVVARANAGNVLALPPAWRYTGVALGAGKYHATHNGKATVMGQVAALLLAVQGANAGQPVTGAMLVQAMVAHNWAAWAVKTRYAANGLVCAHWCAGYVSGAVRNGILAVA